MSLPTGIPESLKHAHSYKVLQAAIQKVQESVGYDSLATHTQVQNVFRECFGSDAHAWQLDVTEVLLLGLDTLLIVGTGTGKVMPFMMPLLLDQKAKHIVISPLKVLQADQACRCRKLKIPAMAVNGETWNKTLQKELEENKYQGILASPEMCIKHAEFRRMLTDSNFKNVGVLIVDEAHCIVQWGGEFWTAYMVKGLAA